MFFRDVALLFRRDIMKPADGTYRINTYGMFKNYFKVGVRNLLKYKLFSFINIFGLAAAMSVCMLLILMLIDQNSYDDFHAHQDRVYRIIGKPDAESNFYATTAYPIAQHLENDFPFIEKSASLRSGFGGDAAYEDKGTELRGFFASENFLQVLDFPMVAGNRSLALNQPKSIVISESKAFQLFGYQEALGKVVTFQDRGLHHMMDIEGDSPPEDWGQFTVTGVIADNSFKSHLKFDVLASSTTLPGLYRDSLITDQSKDWEAYFSSYNYVKLRQENDQLQLDLALDALAKNKYGDLKNLQDFQLISQPIATITPGPIINNEPSFRLPEVAYYVLSFLAFIIMLMACLNYINLSIARAITRTREIGIRKVNGAGKKALMSQFLFESVLTTLLAMLLALAMLVFVKEAFMGLWANQYLNFELTWTPQAFVWFLGFSVVIGLLAGIYPASFLSRKVPLDALRHQASPGNGKWALQKVLNVSQFVVSLLFIVSAMVVHNQFRHYLSYEYGFKSENVINIPLQSNDLDQLRVAFAKIPGVETISACEFIPATGVTDHTMLISRENAEEHINLQLMRVDESFLPNLQVSIIAGEGLRIEDARSSRMVINEAALAKLGFENPSSAIGEVWESTELGQMQIVGVAKNFRGTLLINGDDVRPAALINEPSRFNYLNVRVSGANTYGAIAGLEEAWEDIDPVHDFEYVFFDRELANTNLFLLDIVSIIGYVSFLAILIACLGLLGIATYATQRKLKEVGIRKVLGAAEIQLVLILSKSFLKLLAIAVVIASPLSYLLNRLWLDNLPNRVDFSFSTVLIGTTIMLFLGLLAIGSQTLRAARLNPVETLKDE